MEDKIITIDILTENILGLIGIDKIELLGKNMLVYKDEIYKYNNRYYKCIKNGQQSLPTEEYFRTVSIANVV